jgi:hypothetical protein
MTLLERARELATKNHETLSQAEIDDFVQAMVSETNEYQFMAAMQHLLYTESSPSTTFWRATVLRYESLDGYASGSLAKRAMDIHKSGPYRLEDYPIQPKFSKGDKFTSTEYLDTTLAYGVKVEHTVEMLFYSEFAGQWVYKAETWNNFNETNMVTVDA